MNLKILLSGDGGQGIQLIANMICSAAFDGDFHITSIPNYGLEQRGGVSINFIQISDKKIVYPKFSDPDIILIMSDQANRRTEIYKNPGAKIIHIDKYRDLFDKEDVPLRSYNVFFLGMFSNLLEEKQICPKQKIDEMFQKKLSTKPGWEDNQKAFVLGVGI